MTSTMTVRGQTAIPAVIRKKYHMTEHTRLEWIDDGHSLTVVPVPADPIAALRGSKKGLLKALLASRAEERR